ncbi:kinase-like domain-containing protein [Globomyces pollinis-pini]|nr:kinase-like domain-containing protein [Globomyces pollinis-pini]
MIGQQKQKQKERVQTPIPPEFLKDSKNNKIYHRLNPIGQGGFATCYRVSCQNNQDCAAKVVYKPSLKSSKQRLKLLSEIKIHQNLYHQNIVSFLDVFEDDVYVYIILELCTNTTLVDLIRKRKRLSNNEVRFYMFQLLDGVRYMHRKGYIHRDIKLGIKIKLISGNLFLDENMNLKIGDFGLAATIEHDGERKKTICGTPNYIAPEILFDTTNGHSFEADIWSLGVVMYTLLIGKPPFQTKDVKSIYKKIRDNMYEFPEDISISPNAKIIIQSLLTTKPECRPTIDDVMEHDYFCSEPMPKSIPVSAFNQIPDLEFCTLDKNNNHQPSNVFDNSGKEQLKDNERPLDIKNESESKETSRVAMITKPRKNVTEVRNRIEPPPPLPPRHITKNIKSKESIVELKSQINRLTMEDQIIKENQIKSLDDQKQKSNESIQNQVEQIVKSRSIRSTSKQSESPVGLKVNQIITEMYDSPKKQCIKNIHTNQFNENEQNFEQKQLKVENQNNNRKELTNSYSKTSHSTSSSPSNLSDSSSHHNSIISILITIEKSSNVLQEILENLTNALNGVSKEYTDLETIQRHVQVQSGIEPPSVFITKWIDYTNKYGLSYQLRDGSTGVYFNDGTSIILLSNQLNFEYLYHMGKDRILIRKRYTMLEFPKELIKKVTLLNHFMGYMQANLTKAYIDTSKPHSTNTIHYLTKYLRTKNGVLFRLSNQTIQVNFFDHTKLILEQYGKVVTFIDMERNMVTIPLQVWMEFPVLMVVQRLMYCRDILIQMVSKKG